MSDGIVFLDYPCPKCQGQVGHRINCPDGIAFTSKEPAQEPVRISITWNFEICRLCGSTDAAHNLIPENFDHDFMGELKRADLKETAWSSYD